MSNIDIGSLNRAIKGINDTVLQVGSALEGQISVVDANVGQVRSDLKLTSDELKELRREFDEFTLQAQRVARVQQSETKIGSLKAELDRQYGHYDVVRRTSTGLLQAFDVGNVTNEVARAVSEELMIQTPRYWLAPAIVALSAWSLDNTEIADKSVQEAYARDQNKTSLFFALVLRRQGRTDSAVRWLRHYLSSLDPTALTREFAVILEATSYDAFGPAGQRLLTERMTKWRDELRTRQDIVEAQIDSWVKEFDIESQALASSEYRMLAELSPQWPAVKAQLEAASALPQVHDKYQKIKDFDSALPKVLEDLLDDILDDLVREFDEEELPLRREVTYHEAIVEEEGDKERAEARAAAFLKALEDTHDVVSLQTQAAINPQSLGVSTQTQRIAIGVGQSDFRTAVGRYCAKYRQSHVSSVQVTLGPSHSNYATTYSFPGWTGRTDQDEQEATQALRRVWNKVFDDLVASLRFDNNFYLKPGLIAFGIAIVAFFISPPIGLLAVAVGAGIVYYLGDKEQKKAQVAIDAVNNAREPAMDKSVSMYRDAVAEFVDAEVVYADLDSQESDVLHLIDSWPAVAAHREGAVS